LPLWRSCRRPFPREATNQPSAFALDADVPTVFGITFNPLASEMHPNSVLLAGIALEPCGIGLVEQMLNASPCVAREWSRW